MSNPFKNPKNKRIETLNSESNRERESMNPSQNNRTSIFKNENVTNKNVSNKIYYEVKEGDFPELCNSNQLGNSEKCLMDFKNASLKEAPIIEETQHFEPGWLYMKYGPNKQIMQKFIPKNDMTINTTNISLQDKLNIDMNSCIEKMEERHKTFIESYGEENYERDYHIENYNEMADKYDDNYSSDISTDGEY